LVLGLPKDAPQIGATGEQGEKHDWIKIEARIGMSAISQVISLSENQATPPSGTKEITSVASTYEAECSDPLRVSRRRLPDERRAVTHHFSIAGQEGYLTVGLYEDGTPGEIFIRMAKDGSTISGLMDSFATVVSLALQHGVPLRTLCEKLKHTRFEPSGWSGNPKIGYASSLMDYLFRYMELRFLNREQGELFALLPSLTPARLPSAGKGAVEALGELVELGDAPACNICGALMVRSGSCHRCMTCGSTSGCS
jgi:ribonucleoside-diphosphate reductase alpha chain